MKNIFKLMCLFAALFAVACDTPEPEPKPEPEPEPTPTAGAVTMTDIEIVDILDIAAYFSVTVTNMDDFGFMVIEASAYTEKSADEIIDGSGDFSLDDGNTSWEAPLTIPFEEDLVPETEYVVVVAAKNSTSEVVKSATFTTLKQDMVVEKLSFHPTEVSIESNGTHHFMKMSSSRYELAVTLVGSEVFGGRYDNNKCVEESCVCDTQCTEEVCVCEKIENGFIADGAYFKTAQFDGSWLEYTNLSTSVGNVDFYENVVTGLWEIYGSFCFALNEDGTSLLTIEVEAPSGLVIASKKRTDPYVFTYPFTDKDGNVVPLSATAEKSDDNANVWNLTVANDKDNTLTFTINLGEDKPYIPSGTYAIDNQTTSCSMIVNNVATSAADASKYDSKLVVTYDEATQESYVSVDVMVKAGTAVVQIDNAGPFKLYEKVVVETKTFDEARNLMIWSSYYNGRWELDWSGDKFYGFLYFVTDNSEYLPAGRYYLRSTAPSDGSLWVDCGRSYVAYIRTTDELSLVCDGENDYIDITVEENKDGVKMHTIVGTLKTTDGSYIINYNYDANNRGPI